MTWLDKPFFDLLSQINSLFGYFMKISWAIAGVLLTINLGIFWIKFALTHTGFKEEFVRTISACLLFFIIISSYPAIITGLNSLVYKMAMASTYTTHVTAMIDKTKDDSGFWDKKGEKADASYSDIVGKIETIGTGGEVSEQYVLDLYLEDTGYFSPNAVMRVITLIVENIWHRINLMDKNAFGIPKDIFGAVMMILTCLAVLLCGILGAAQYFIAALEFSFISAVGVIVLPGMMWNGTKFMSEKLFGAIFGFFLKMLFVSISLMLMFTGFLAMATKPFDGSLDQVIYTVFTSILYMMICQSGPQLAVSMLTGTPQMSLMEGVRAGAALAGGAALAATSAQKATQAAVVHGAGFVAQTAGAVKSGATKAHDAAGGGGKGVAAGVAGAVGGVLASTGKTALNTVQSGAHSVLHGGSKSCRSSTLSGGKAKENKYSNTEKFHGAGTAGYLKQRFNEGDQIFKDGSKKNEPDFIEKTPKTPSSPSTQHGVPPGSPPSGLPSPSAQQGLPAGNTPLALPPPPASSTPSTLNPSTPSAPPPSSPPAPAKQS